MGCGGDEDIPNLIYYNQKKEMSWVSLLYVCSK